ncbi:MAG: Imm6 family immunity protein [Gammaproteobacteria bacterium]|nr:Imm6 family immunity protein [Gammaproteobacteria bacterium]
MASISDAARAAYVLALAEWCVADVKEHDEYRRKAENALDAAWKWIDGGGVGGAALYSFLERQLDVGLAIFLSGTGVDSNLGLN